MSVVSFSEKRFALAFSDYLRSQGLANHVQADEHGYAVVLADASQSEQARMLAEEFVQQPDDPKYWQASWQSGRPQKEAVYAERPVSEAPTSAWWQRAGGLTRGLALLCALIFLAQSLMGEAVFQALRYADGISLAALQQQWWRLLTPALLHFSLLHLTFNLLWWWELAGLIERMQSRWRLLGLTLVIALVSNAVQFLSYGPDFGGLSAVIYGLLGYLWIYPYADPAAPFRLRGAIIGFLLGWLALGYTGIFDALFGPISNNGHLAGLLTGAGLGLLLGLVNYRRPDAE